MILPGIVSILPLVVRDAMGDQALAQFGRRDRPHAASGGIQFKRMRGEHLVGEIGASRSARLLSAPFRSSSGKPASRSAPSAMSTEMPENQSKYSTWLTDAPPL